LSLLSAEVRVLCKTIAKLFGNIDYFAIVIIPTLIYCIVDTIGEPGAYRKLFKTYFFKNSDFLLPTATVFKVLEIIKSVEKNMDVANA